MFRRFRPGSDDVQETLYPVLHATYLSSKLLYPQSWVILLSVAVKSEVYREGHVVVKNH